ncbi:MAG: TonB-dependent receptor, partial [Proteobacteria bacterium]|nr:TonB-dependent receptor [Pseudomonadota bacterium]
INHAGSKLPEFKPNSGGESSASGDPSARVSLFYRPNESHLIKAALGNYNQSPKPHGVLSDTAEGSQLASTKAAHYMIGYELYNDLGLHVDIQSYFNYRWDIPCMNNQENPQWENSGLGRSYGIELLIRTPRTERFSGWLSYTLSRSEENLQGTYHLIDQDQSHNIQLVNSFFLPKLWKIGTKIHYTTGNPFTPLL